MVAFTVSVLKPGCHIFNIYLVLLVMRKWFCRLCNVKLSFVKLVLR